MDNFLRGVLSGVRDSFAAVGVACIVVGLVLYFSPADTPKEKLDNVCQ